MPTTVAVLGGNSVVGRALEALLQSAGYDTRLIKEPTTGKPEELLQGVHLLLLAPTSGTGYRERFLVGMGSTPGTAAIPVLPMSTAPRRVLAGQTGLVPWPCRLEGLKKKIETALPTMFYARVSAE